MAIKIEFMGGPRCGETMQVNDERQEVVVMHNPAPGDRWAVTYRRTGMRMQSSAASRFDYAGQERGA